MPCHGNLPRSGNAHPGGDPFDASKQNGVHHSSCSVYEPETFLGRNATPSLWSYGGVTVGSLTAIQRGRLTETHACYALVLSKRTQKKKGCNLVHPIPLSLNPVSSSSCSLPSASHRILRPLFCARRPSPCWVDKPTQSPLLSDSEIDRRCARVVRHTHSSAHLGIGIQPAQSFTAAYFAIALVIRVTPPRRHSAHFEAVG